MKRHALDRSMLLAMLVIPLIAAAIAPVLGGTTGIISGTVTDFATGDKLAGVNVVVEGTNLTTVTDQNGYFAITNVPPAEYRVTASLVGYADFQMTKVSVLMDVTTTVDCSMSQAVADEETVVVKESRPMIQRDVIPTTYVVDTKQEQMVRAQPMNLYQATAVVLSQPGVIADENGFPHIRGGRANDVAYLIDGIPVTEPIDNAFGTDIVTVGLDKMEIFTGGYRPEYGNAVSGVFNQVVKTGKTAPGASIEFMGGGQSFYGIYPQIGGSGKNFDYYLGGYMWNTEFEGQMYNEGGADDFLGKFNYDLNAKNKLTLLSGSGVAKYKFPGSHTQTYGADGLEDIPLERDFQRQSYSLNALTWTHRLSPASFFTLRPYYFHSGWNMEGLSDEFGLWWDAESATTGLQFDYTNQLSERHLLKAGASRMSSNNLYWINVPMAEYEYTAGADTKQTGMYIQDQMHLSAKWRLEAGLRYDRMNYDNISKPDSNDSQWSPRFGASYAVDAKTNLRFSYGKMIQFMSTDVIDRVYGIPEYAEYYGIDNSALKPQRSTQYDLGWERQVSNDYTVQVTPFYRKMSNLLQFRSLNEEDPSAPPYQFDSIGDGNSKGVELLMKKRPSKNWSGWLAYTYCVAKAESSSTEALVTGDKYYVDWDQRHTVVAVLNYNKNNWDYSLVGEYGSGLPWTGETEVDTGEGTETIPDEIVNTRRVGSHTVFSLNASREVKGGWLPAGEIKLGVANIFNSRTALGRSSSGAASTKLSPRFMNVSYIRRF